MIFDVITLFPELIDAYCHSGVVGRAHEKGLVTTCTWNPRAYTSDVHKTVDDRPYGGGPGMVMKYAPLKDALDAVALHRGDRGIRIYLSPRGCVFNQKIAKKLMKADNIVLLCGRYEGIDERIVATEIDLELSVGDFILSGGELAASIVIDSVVRLLPGVLSNKASHENDSFGDNNLLDCPHYTRPEEINGLRVPDILLSGDHDKIRAWREAIALKETQERRPDLLNNDTDTCFVK